MRFLLVDRIQVTEDGCCGTKLASMSEDYFEWHFPGRPVVPGNLILEAAVQTAGWWTASRTDFQTWLLLDRVETARFYAFAVPGHTIEMHLRETSATEGRRHFEVDCTVDGARSATLAFGCSEVELDALMDPADARRDFEQLTGAPA